MQDSHPAANAELITAANILRGTPHLLIAARGTSAHAGDFARYHYARRLGLLSSMTPLSLFADPFPGPALAGAVMLAISQSGSSPDLVAAVRKARCAHGATTLALTNSTSSALAKQSDVVISLST